VDSARAQWERLPPNASCNDTQIEAAGAGRLPGQVNDEECNRGPEGSDQQTGKHQAVGELQAGSDFGRVPRLTRMVCPMKFPKSRKSPHKPATIR